MYKNVEKIIHISSAHRNGNDSFYKFSVPLQDTYRQVRKIELLNVKMYTESLVDSELFLTIKELSGNFSSSNSFVNAAFCNLSHTTDTNYLIQNHRTTNFIAKEYEPANALPGICNISIHIHPGTASTLFSDSYHIIENVRIRCNEGMSALLNAAVNGASITALVSATNDADAAVIAAQSLLSSDGIFGKMKNFVASLKWAIDNFEDVDGNVLRSASNLANAIDIYNYGEYILPTITTAIELAVSKLETTIDAAEKIIDALVKGKDIDECKDDYETAYDDAAKAVADVVDLIELDSPAIRAKNKLNAAIEAMVKVADLPPSTNVDFDVEVALAKETVATATSELYAEYINNSFTFRITYMVRCFTHDALQLGGRIVDGHVFA